MADEWDITRIGRQIEDLDRKVRWVERHLEGRQRIREETAQRAFLVGAMVIATVTAVVVADRRGS
jgi:hypothetical protein